MEAFSAFLKLKRQVSEATVLSYVQDIRRFAVFLGKDPAKGQASDIEAYVAQMKTRGRSAATIRRALSALHIYYGYLLQSGKCHKDPTAQITRPEESRKLPQILTPEEAIRLLEAPQGDSVISIRDRAMLELLYATGMTVSELIGLQIENVNLRRRALILRHGKRQRTVLFGRPAATALDTYLKKARPLLLQSGGDVALFINCNGTPLSRQGFWKLIKKYKARAGIDKEITPHMLRHSFAAHLLEGGADLISLQEMMGFTDPASTAIYTKIVENKIAEVYRKAHPRAN